jgi:hypothetical protein
MLKILHIILALHVLLSSTGVTVFEHLCQMRGRTIGVFIKPHSCCAQKESYRTSWQKSQTCHLNKTPQINRKPCCQDKSQFLKSDIKGAPQKIASPAFHFQVFAFQALPARALELDFTPISQKTLRFYLYKPPPQVTDIRVFIQSFLC